MNRQIRDFDGMTADPKFRRFVRTIFKLSPAREIRPLSEEPRIGNANEDYDAFTEYGFLPEKCNTWSDEDVQERIDDMVEYVTGPYDCTGQRFTMWIAWHRNPGGRISFVHRLGIDV